MCLSFKICNFERTFQLQFPCSLVLFYFFSCANYWRIPNRNDQQITIQIICSWQSSNLFWISLDDRFYYLTFYINWSSIWFCHLIREFHFKFSSEISNPVNLLFISEKNTFVWRNHFVLAFFKCKLMDSSVFFFDIICRRCVCKHSSWISTYWHHNYL